ncbi:hypothetical protein RJ639_039558, partial [Escallonia herrerae]
MMCPLSLVFPPADIGLWTEEELFKSLGKIIDGSPLPGNVIADVNPYQYKPSHLPEGIWYLIRSEGKRDSENGFWKVKGKACEIFTNSTITGWRTTLEFYEGQAPHGRRTDWLIQEYGITYKGVGNKSKPKDSKSLCRIFHSDQQGSDHELPPQYGEADTARKNQADSILASIPKADSSTGRGSLRQSQEKIKSSTGPLPVRADDPPAENLSNSDYILSGDYIELDDLADPRSPSSSSDNSSCLSLTSDECFDTLALLQDLEDEHQKQQAKDASFKYTVSARVKPNEVVLRPANIGSIISSIHKSDDHAPGSATRGKSLTERAPDHANRSQQAQEGTSNCHNVAALSSKHKALLDGQQK